MRHPSLGAWEERLKRLLDEVDDFLENAYGRLYPLHPARKRRGTTANKEHDGLFDIGSTFTPGFGSARGRGYVVTVTMVTLARIPPDVIEKIEAEAIRMMISKKSV